MTITVVSVHPTRTVVQAGEEQIELPTDAFSPRPVAGQAWELSLTHQLDEREKIDLLNQHLKH